MDNIITKTGLYGKRRKFGKPVSEITINDTSGIVGEPNTEVPITDMISAINNYDPVTEEELDNVLKDYEKKTITATFEKGYKLNTDLTELAGDDTYIRFIKRSQTPPDSSKITKIISDASSESQVVAWYESEGNSGLFIDSGGDPTCEISTSNPSGIIWYYTIADKLYFNEDSGNAFQRFYNLEAIDGISEMDTSKCTDISRMFDSCFNLKLVNVSKWDVSKVETMQSLFFECYQLEIYGLENWNTSNVYDMMWIFSGNLKISRLDFMYGWNLDNLEDISSAFDRTSITEIDFGQFDSNFPKLRRMDYIASDCPYLTSINFGGKTFPALTLMERLFANIPNLTTILSLNSIDTSKVTNMDGLFWNASKIADWSFLANLDTSSVTNAGLMFRNSNITDAEFNTYIKNFNLSNCEEAPSMFSGCTGLENVDLSDSNWNLSSKFVKMYEMFEKCTNLKSANLSGLNLSQVNRIYGLFDECEKLLSVNLSNTNINKITSMSRMFYGCDALTTITGLDQIDTSNVTTMEGLFRFCADLPNDTINQIKNWNVGNVEDLTGIFYGCKAITNLDLSSWNISNKLTILEDAFYLMSKLQTVNVSNWDTSNVTNMKYVFCSCSKLNTIIGLNTWNTQSATSFYSMFNGLEITSLLDISNWNVSNVTNMYNMFRMCDLLESIDLSSWDVSNVTNFSYIFHSCKVLSSESIHSLDNWNVSSGTKFTNAFRNVPEYPNWNGTFDSNGTFTPA